MAAQQKGKGVEKRGGGWWAGVCLVVQWVSTLAGASVPPGCAAAEQGDCDAPFMAKLGHQGHGCSAKRIREEQDVGEDKSTGVQGRGEIVGEGEHLDRLLETLQDLLLLGSQCQYHSIASQRADYSATRPGGGERVGRGGVWEHLGRTFASLQGLLLLGHQVGNAPLMLLLHGSHGYQECLQVIGVDDLRGCGPQPLDLLCLLPFLPG